MSTSHSYVQLLCGSVINLKTLVSFRVLLYYYTIQYEINT